MAVSYTTVLGKPYKLKSQLKSAAPKTIEEAIATLARVAPDDGRVLAGGQSLVPTRLVRPRHLVDINGVAALTRLAVEGRETNERREFHQICGVEKF
jgi:FAD binding domain in molybdopterin dehydrogenase